MSTCIVLVTVMDPKATVKSKRGHSLHGRRSNPSSSSIAAKKKASTSFSASGAGVQSKRIAPRPQHRPELPSNWDRYDDDEDDNYSGTMGGEKGESSSATMAAQGSEMLAKSKEANYCYLIEQARSQFLP